MTHEYVMGVNYAYLTTDKKEKKTLMSHCD